MRYFVQLAVSLGCALCFSATHARAQCPQTVLSDLPRFADPDVEQFAQAARGQSVAATLAAAEQYGETWRSAAQKSRAQAAQEQSAMQQSVQCINASSTTSVDLNRLRRGGAAPRDSIWGNCAVSYQLHYIAYLSNQALASAIECVGGSRRPGQDQRHPALPGSNDGFADAENRRLQGDIEAGRLERQRSEIIANSRAPSSGSVTASVLNDLSCDARCRFERENGSQEPDFVPIDRTETEQCSVEFNSTPGPLPLTRDDGRRQRIPLSAFSENAITYSWRVEKADVLEIVSDDSEQTVTISGVSPGRSRLTVSVLCDPSDPVKGRAEASTEIQVICNPNDIQNLRDTAQVLIDEAQRLEESVNEEWQTILTRDIPRMIKRVDDVYNASGDVRENVREIMVYCKPGPTLPKCLWDMYQLYKALEEISDELQTLHDEAVSLFRRIENLKGIKVSAKEKLEDAIELLRSAQACEKPGAPDSTMVRYLENYKQQIEQDITEMEQAQRQVDEQIQRIEEMQRSTENLRREIEELFEAHKTDENFLERTPPPNEELDTPISGPT
ncbi:MAG: hypothetical protein AAGL90_16775 [Pseudomonadota bacterium]